MPNDHARDCLYRDGNRIAELPADTKQFADYFDVTKGGRLSFDWQVPGDAPRPEVKLAFLAMLCCETAMPYGGRITFARQDGGWQISSNAPKLKFDEALWASLSHRASAPPTPAQVHFPLLAAELLAQRRAVKVAHSATDILMDM